MSSKQAELRRLMKLHRAKLDTKQQTVRPVHDVENEVTPQRNKPVKGILKPSSFRHANHSQCGVANLVSGYASSSSESERDENDSNDGFRCPSRVIPLEPTAVMQSFSRTPNNFVEPSKFRFQTNNAGNEVQSDRPSSTSDEAFDKPLLSSPEKTFELLQQDATLGITTTSATTTSTSEQNMETVWQEFESFLTNDEVELSEKTVTSQSSSPVPNTAEEASSLVESQTTSDENVSRYEEESEQTGYEARLARLRAKIRKRPVPEEKQLEAELPAPSPTSEPSNMIPYLQESLLPSAPVGEFMRKKRARARALVGWGIDVRSDTGSNPGPPI